ncbi:hypothetical protein [uncultured Treponema sp.]|uniref:hypothetical protein n=1 Tax=uncultured Treponema sp. TaxID=162155 RepID=UPI002632F12C|nr:hypothetical protein [uncultured Treponema sp.]
MKIFIIKGKENSGKTNAIRNIFQTIVKSEHGNVLSYETKGADYCDFISVVELKGKKIAINSLGDCVSYVKNGKSKAEKENADIFITAWTSKLDKNQDLKEILPNSVICEDYKFPEEKFLSEQTQWISEFLSNLV